MTAFEKRIIILNLLAKSSGPVFRREIEDFICLGQVATSAILKELRECGFVKYSGVSRHSSYVLTDKAKEIFKF